MTRKGLFKELARSEGGFTLIEIILVTVIIAILAATVVVSYSGITTDAKIRTALSDIRSYQDVLERYALEHDDRYPKTLDELASGAKKYVKEINSDPWGNPYVYLIPGEHYPESFDILSMGPDGQRGTSDDVAPWLVKKKE